MNKPELYQRTVDILVQAYFNDTLEHGNCHACAVGNMIAANMGYVITNHPAPPGRLTKGWDGLCVYQSEGPYEQPVEWLRFINKTGELTPLCKKQIDSTGYSVNDLAVIENKFEWAEVSDLDDKMFGRLMAVIEVLDQIHGNTDAAVTTNSKNRFQKQTA